MQTDIATENNMDLDLDNILYLAITAAVVEALVYFFSTDRASLWCAVIVWRLIDIERKVDWLRRRS